MLKTAAHDMSHAEIVRLLLSEDFSDIYSRADEITRCTKGNVIQVRAILEFSNVCMRSCLYCGLNCKNKNLKRYRMSPEEIIETSAEAWEAGYKTVVLQSGEDRWFTADILADIVREIKKTGIAVTLSSGEMSESEYAVLKDAGADRYLLKHETADESIYARLHPDSSLLDRISCLKNLVSLGYETGSGFMIGLPGQTVSTIASDILLTAEIGCHMAGVGPFIPHPDTPLKNQPAGSTELTKRAVSVLRILMPNINLPATTALGVIDGEEKTDVFSCGANVIMRKVTPTKYKYLYEIYPSAMFATDIRAERMELERQIKNLGKIPI